MDKLKLVIADDEINVRNAIRKMINWEEEGIDVCGLAENGKQALQIIEENDADIALLDIRMPGMTGLEILAKLKENNRSTKTIILSGYDEFNYAREALVQGASNYLLKPCKPKDILAAVKEVGEKIRKEREREDIVKESERELLKKPYDFKNRLLSELIWTGEEKRLLSLEEEFGIHVGERLSIIIIHPAKGTLFFREHQEYIVSYLEEKLAEIVGSVAENMVALINVKEEFNKKEVRAVLRNMREKIKEKYNIEINIGVGSIETPGIGIYESYQKALKALDMAYFVGSEFIIFYDSIYETDKNTYPTAEENNILNALKENDKKLCDDGIDSFFKASRTELSEIGSTTKIGMALLLSLYRYTLTSGLETEKIFGDSFDLLNQIQSSRSPGELVKLIKEQCYRIIRQSKGMVTENQFVNAAVAYINQNYYRDITLTMVAEEICLSPGYLSTLFKQVKGDSFINYLSRVRIRHACNLMQDVRLKNYEISYQVGFQNEKYFSKVFRKIMGESPNEFRKK